MIPFVIFLTVLIHHGQAADEDRTQVYSYEGEITFVHLEDENEEVEVPIAKVFNREFYTMQLFRSKR